MQSEGSVSQTIWHELPYVPVQKTCTVIPNPDTLGQNVQEGNVENVFWTHTPGDSYFKQC